MIGINIELQESVVIPRRKIVFPPNYELNVITNTNPTFEPYH